MLNVHVEYTFFCLIFLCGVKGRKREKQVKMVSCKRKRNINNFRRRFSLMIDKLLVFFFFWSDASCMPFNCFLAFPVHFSSITEWVWGRGVVKQKKNCINARFSNQQSNKFLSWIIHVCNGCHDRNCIIIIFFGLDNLDKIK